MGQKHKTYPTCDNVTVKTYLTCDNVTVPVELCREIHSHQTEENALLKTLCELLLDKGPCITL